MRSFTAAALVLLGFSIAQPAHAATLRTFGGVGMRYSEEIEAGYWPSVSADGTKMVGASGASAYRWLDGVGVLALSGVPTDQRSTATGVSDDGLRISGAIFAADRSGAEAFVWKPFIGATGLGDFAGGAFNSAAYDVSGDGLTAVGYGTNAAGRVGFRWTQAEGMVALGHLAGGGTDSVATGASADASVIVGTSDSANGTEAFMWTPTGGMVGLGDLDGGYFSSMATSVSDDGSTVVGQGRTLRSEPMRWTAETGMHSLGGMNGGPVRRGVAWDTSGDGSVVVGFTDLDTTGDEAFIWDEAHGMRALEDVITGLGVDLGEIDLTSADGISADGRTIVGRTSTNQFFVVNLPEPSTGLLVAFGMLLMGRRPGRG